MEFCEPLKAAFIPAANSAQTAPPSLDPEGVVPFLVAQLKRASLPANMLRPAAIIALARYSAGVPQTLQLLASLAIFLARMEDAAFVTAAHVERAAAIAQDSEPEDDSSLDDDLADSLNDARPGPVAMPPIAGPARAEAGLSAQPPRQAALRKRLVASVIAIGCVAAIGLAMQLEANRHVSRPVVTSPSPAPLPSTAALPPPAPLPAPPPQIVPPQLPEAPPSGATAKPAAPPAIDHWVADHPVRAEPTHVVVNYTHGDQPARRRAGDIVRALKARQFSVAGPEAAAPTREDGISYFFRDDEDVATGIAQIVAPRWPDAAGVRLASLPRSRPPRPGTIRITLPQSAKPG